MTSGQLLERLAYLVHLEHDERRASALRDGVLRYWCPLLAHEAQRRSNIASAGYNVTE